MLIRTPRAAQSRGLDGLLRLPLGTILARPALGELYRVLLRETVAIGRARGVPLPEAIVERHWEGLVSLMAENPGAHTSLYHDLVAGRLCWPVYW